MMADGKKRYPPECAPVPVNAARPTGVDAPIACLCCLRAVASDVAMMVTDARENQQAAEALTSLRDKVTSDVIKRDELRSVMKALVSVPTPSKKVRKSSAKKEVKNPRV
jgi:hypothetical protein